MKMGYGLWNALLFQVVSVKVVVNRKHLKILRKLSSFVLRFVLSRGCH